MKKNIFIVRPLPHGSNHMKDFLEKDIIAVGYPVGKSLKNFSSNDIKLILKPFGWETGLGNVNSLVNSMDIGDIVVVPDENGKDVYFAEITSEYTYIKELDEDKKGSGYPHQRKVKWFFDKKPLIRKELPEELRASLRFPGTVASITKHHDIVMDILDNGGNTNKEFKSLEEEAMRVLKELLESDNVENKLRAAEIILKSK